jgi:carboxypeptidase family protein/TonB-dependent receptor-like protein
MQLRVFPEKFGFVLTVFLAIFIHLTSQAYAQVAGATLTGTVMDSSGAVIPKAQVTVTDVATGVSRRIATDNAGFYAAPNLLPGNYRVSITAPGFSTEVRTGITLTVGAQQVLDVAMRVGQVTETVQVTGEAPLVQLASSTISGEVNATTVRELPLNGRSWTDLAKLQPGVVAAQTHASQDVNRGFGAQLSISGARPQQNNYRLDGVSINDYSNGGPGSVLGQNLGVDAIQEFSVLTSNYSAEYGKTSGGVVNAITRSGTNTFHGSAYEFLRNSALDANDFFANAGGKPKPSFRQNQFGVSAGGPIRKDHTFFFGDYEGIRYSKGVTTVDTVPSLAVRGLMADGKTPTAAILCSNPPGPDPANPCSPHAVTGAFVADQVTGIDQTVLRYLPFFQLPNGRILGNGDLAQFTFDRRQIVSENYFTTRVDQRISEKDSLFGTYSFDNSPLTQPNVLDDVLESSTAKRQIAAIEESHVFSPTLVNSLRIGFNRDRANSGGSIKVINPVAADTSSGLGWAPGLPPPQANVSGVDRAPGFAPPTFAYVWNAYQAYDDAFVTRGLHSLKFGVGVERDQLNETTNTADYLGTFVFGSMKNFLTNAPKSVAGVVPGLATPRYMRLTIAGAYVQDDWRWRPNLTLNLGLRYEMATVLTETKGKLTNLPTIDAATPHLGDPYFSNPTLRNFEPRIGFAWDPFRNGKTAVRGGFGMFDVLPMLYTTVTMNGRGAPFFEIASSTSLPKGSFPSGALPFILAQGGGGTFEYGYVEPHPKRNYVMQWNLNVQRQLTPSLTAQVGYVGSRGVHQAFRADDENIVMPTRTSAGYLWPVLQDTSTIADTGAPTPTPGSFINPNTNVGAIRFLDWGGDSFYHALQVGVLKRMSHGLQIQGSYTWGKSIDEGSGVVAGDTLANGIGSLQWFDLKSIRGLSDYNIGRVFVVNGTWDLPTLKSAPPVVGWAANGWELGGILKLSDGPPFSATFGTDGDPLGIRSTDPWDFANRLTGPGCASLVNPRNPNNYVKTACFAVPTAPASFFTPTASTPMCSSDPVFGANAVGTPPQCFNLRGNAGRNIIPGPGLINLDFSIFKNNPVRRISESFNVQFRAEFFNILNRANFATPKSPNNTDIFDSTGAANGSAGLLTSTVTDAREIQFAIKVIW